MEKKLVYYISTVRMLQLMAISTVIIWIGVYCLREEGTMIPTIGLLNLLIGIPGPCIALYAIFSNKPQVVLSDSGIEDRRIMKRAIAWEDITEASITEESNRQVLQLNHSGAVHDDRFKLLFRRTAKSDLERNVIKMNMDQLNMNREDIVQFLSYKGYQST